MFKLYVNFSENLSVGKCGCRKILCRKICLVKFGVGKFVSENLMSENLFWKIRCRKICCQKIFGLPYFTCYTFHQLVRSRLFLLMIFIIIISNIWLNAISIIYLKAVSIKFKSIPNLNLTSPLSRLCPFSLRHLILVRNNSSSIYDTKFMTAFPQLVQKNSSSIYDTKFIKMF